MAITTDFLSQAQRTAAVEDAKAILAASVVMRKMLAVRTIALRLVSMADAQTASELNHGWDVDAKSIAELFAAASCQRAMRSPGSIEDLQRDVWETVMPVLNVLS
jgi:hypothetical protein